MVNNYVKLWKLLNFYSSLSKKYNLMAPHGNRRLIFYKHIKESLYYVEQINQFFKNIQINDIKVLDMGTGSGFPGIPMAIFRDNIKFTLLDRKEKQIKLLEKCCKILNIKNVELECTDLDIKSSKHHSIYDCIVTRAFARMDNILDYSNILLKTDGIVIAGKGENKEKIFSKYKNFNLIKVKNTDFGNVFVFRKG